MVPRASVAGRVGVHAVPDRMDVRICLYRALGRVTVLSWNGSERSYHGDAMTPSSEDELLDLGRCAQLLGVSRWWLWLRARTGLFVAPHSTKGGTSYWTKENVYSWAASPAVGLSSRVPIRFWPPAHKPAAYFGARQLSGGNAIAQGWETSAGKLFVVWPLSGHTYQLDSIGAEFPEAAGIAVMEWDFGITGPGVTDVSGAGEIGWQTLTQIVGRPLPYWPTTLRVPELMLNWTTDQETVISPALADLDVAALLQLAASYEDGHPAARTLINLARICADRATSSALGDLEILTANTSADTVVVAARPMAVPSAERDDLDVHQRRAGWLDVLSREDTLAQHCVRELKKWDSGRDLPYGQIERADPSRPHVAEWARRLQRCTRTAAFEIFHSRDGDTFIDPQTDAPVLRRRTDGGERILLASPQRLPATSPLAELVLDEPIWVRTADGTLYPAPQDSYYGITWGYGGTGPRCLASMIEKLLDDITAPGTDLSTSPPESLTNLTAMKLPRGTVLTRTQLEAARDGTWLPEPPRDGAGQDEP